MTCDATSTDELYAGDDLVWDYLTTDDISGWSDLLVKVRAGQHTGTEELASSDADTISIAGGFAGEVPATDFDAGILAWWISSDVSAEWVTRGSRIVYVEARAKVDGVDTVIYPATAYTVHPQVADREVGS